ncbi:MAG: ABC transporter substrate-binding protein [Candidatus Obscuribacterales bacterium]|nr:ABC transporter substrate-binding protein [Candidatus Obscuribacterales bacterium]
MRRANSFLKAILSTSILFLLVVFCLPSFAASGKNTIDRVVGIFSVWTGAEPSMTLYNEVACYIDYGEMAVRSMGKHWSTLSEVERREFVFVFRKLVEERYYKRWHKIFSKGSLKIVKEVPTSGGLFVRTRLILGKQDDMLIWHLSKRSGQYKVVSIAVEGKDLLTRMSGRLQKHMEKDGFQKLLAWMKDEADIEDDDPGLSRVKSTASK